MNESLMDTSTCIYLWQQIADSPGQKYIHGMKNTPSSVWRVHRNCAVNKLCAQEKRKKKPGTLISPAQD
jgi:hypothetical protein